MDQIIFQYGEDNSVNRLWDSVQRDVSLIMFLLLINRNKSSVFFSDPQAECCGFNGPKDWLNNSFIKSLNLTSPDVFPCSCFKNSPSFGSLWCSNNSNFIEPRFGRGNVTTEVKMSHRELYFVFRKPPIFGLNLEYFCKMNRKKQGKEANL